MSNTDHSEPDFDHEEDTVREVSPISLLPLYSAFSSLSLVYALILLLSLYFWRFDFLGQLATSYQVVYGDGLWWTLLTSVFIHSDVSHILANSPMLLVFGYYLHGYFGSKVFPGLCLVIGIITNLICIQFMPERTLLIGASGMVYAMVSLWLVYYIQFEVRFRRSVRIARAIGFSLIVMFPSVYVENVSYLAHAVGFLLGLVFGLVSSFVFEPRYREESGS